ncbi:hypothetical protein [Roseovarius sp. C03]|uniref:hypothetical protein n=1 Tax=Roseovarius sp. C03 TaxID=3449222 RepID=UPI003EDC02FD
MDKPLALNRRVTPPGDRDYFPTPPWATRALCEKLKARGWIKRRHVAWEPACGEGYMSRPLGEYFGTVHATDLVDCRDTYPDQAAVRDFLLDWPGLDPEISADWIVTNPPFNRASDFVELALRRSRVGVAMFLKQQFLEGIGRYRDLFSRHWPRLILQFSERVPLVTGTVDPDARTNQSYLWIVWIRRDAAPALGLDAAAPPEFGWIAPARARLERPSDYRKPRAEEESEPTELLRLMGAPDTPTQEREGET